VDELLKRVVTVLAERPHVALARIWLVDRGDICASCHMAARCPDRTSCLHLVASAGAPGSDNDPDWSRVDGEFSRMPLGVGKVGRVGAIGEAIVVKDFAHDPAWLRRYQWAARAHISGLNVQPIKFKQEILGVLAVFTTIPTPAEGPAWLRIFADEIAGAIVNARAFEEIERLQVHLELENTYLAGKSARPGLWRHHRPNGIHSAIAPPDRGGRSDGRLGPHRANRHRQELVARESSSAVAPSTSSG
jgi:GAF domain-containing protein